MRSPSSDGGQAPANAGSIVQQIRTVGGQHLILLVIVLTTMWGFISAVALYQVIRDRSETFRSLVNSNQEALASGEWRPFVEGLERDQRDRFRDVDICWGSTSKDCGRPRREAGMLDWRLAVPLMSGTTPLLWVVAYVSPGPAVQLSGLVLLTFLLTIALGAVFMMRLRRAAHSAGAALADIVSAAVAQGDGKSLAILPSEIRPLGQALVESLSNLHATRQREAISSALVNLSAQVAHDIRSPLAALEAASDEIRALPESSRLIVRGAIGRIRDIANNLLEQSRPSAVGEPTARVGSERPASAHLLTSLVDSLVSEKRLQFRSHNGVEIDSPHGPETYGLFVDVPASDFKRVLSNLINNAVESLLDSGRVVVKLTPDGDRVAISVVDNGKGIPPGVLNRLGRRGETHGKTGGSGLGLHHAATSIESWGGSLSIDSHEGEGTTVTLSLPRAAPPRWAVPELRFAEGAHVVVLDDDTGIHDVWNNRFNGAGGASSGVKTREFRSPSALREWWRTWEKPDDIALFLFDYEFYGQPETGLSLARDLNIAPRTILVTSRFDEDGVLAEALALGVRIIPKPLAGFVPISFDRTGASEGERTVVLIDDDSLARMTWKTAAARAGLKLKVFSTMSGFYREAPTIDRATPIYIDAELADGMNGAEESVKVRDLGFQEIYLATGHDASRFPAMNHLRGIVGKEPPWRDPPAPPSTPDVRNAICRVAPAPD
jgi:signal transduction histidine kinase